MIFNMKIFIMIILIVNTFTNNLNKNKDSSIIVNEFNFKNDMIMYDIHGIKSTMKLEANENDSVIKITNKFTDVMDLIEVYNACKESNIILSPDNEDNPSELDFIIDFNDKISLKKLEIKNSEILSFTLTKDKNTIKIEEISSSDHE